MDPGVTVFKDKVECKRYIIIKTGYAPEHKPMFIQTKFDRHRFSKKWSSE